jgi:ubiquinone/menaquinone biosynthesis C-methylase UbiE
MAGAGATDPIHEANVRYHDLAAAGYDTKWGIDFGERGLRQVETKLRKALGASGIDWFARGLEIGAGTGYFGLNLVRAGVVEEYIATDVSPGMLQVLQQTANRLGIDARTDRCQAAALPYPDTSFDLVFGHAVLHHLPEPGAALAEVRRVLRPGGVIAFCGEPSRYGDLIARLPKRAGHALAPAWRTAVGAPPAHNGHHLATEQEELERVVDVHAFTPGALARHARAAGFEAVRVCGEELAASVFGWTNRALESTADPAGVPRLWHQYAYRGYLALQVLDRTLLEPSLPAAIFYNLLLSARAPT